MQYAICGKSKIRSVSAMTKAEESTSVVEKQVFVVVVKSQYQNFDFPLENSWENIKLATNRSDSCRRNINYYTWVTRYIYTICQTNSSPAFLNFTDDPFSKAASFKVPYVTTDRLET